MARKVLRLLKCFVLGSKSVKKAAGTFFRVGDAYHGQYGSIF
jgi:hypothetical protein